MKEILAAENLNKKFILKNHITGKKYEKQALKDFSLSLNDSEILAVVGESGSGKTTAARIISGIEKQDSGTVLYKGTPVDYKNEITRREIQYVFQDTFNALNPRHTIRQTLSEPAAKHFKMGKSVLDCYVDELIKKTGLNPEIAVKYPHELSGGQRQRVGIARALSVKPKILVADEPVSSLDVSVQAQVIKLLQNLNEKEKLSLIFITHDLRVVRNFAQTVIVMKDGIVCERGDVQNIFFDPKTEYLKEMLRAIPECGFKTL